MGKSQAQRKKLVATGTSGLVLLENSGLQVTALRSAFVTVTCSGGYQWVLVAGSRDEEGIKHVD